MKRLLGSAAGIIVDTPSSLGSGPASSTEHRQRLIKACVESFRSEEYFLSHSGMSNIENSQCHSRRGARKTERRNAARLWISAYRGEDPKVWWRMTIYFSCLHLR